ncbi:hypothetical protein PTTG_28030 [Puccinia triticina 1-1 BBBD Race 1]|uniref:Uncharacterized protein n=1 Tax=Puccinia triticina (isolate 1-1 / race 1 (BBBD)) TaxID=630390 RepID=A0A180GF49_PUCT1|nr:hypothetical protein PTTG_28030 [Puccinia triticina 1-1 BBBD Race 1]
MISSPRKSGSSPLFSNNNFLQGFQPSPIRTNPEISNMDPISNPGDRTGNSDASGPSPGGSLRGTSALLPTSGLAAHNRGRRSPNLITPAQYYQRRYQDHLNRNIEGILDFFRQVDGQLRQMLAEDPVTGQRARYMRAMSPSLRGRAPSPSQRMNSILDRLESRYLGRPPFPGYERETLPCSICLEDYAEGDRIVFHESHHFHHNCLQVSLVAKQYQVSFVQAFTPTATAQELNLRSRPIEKERDSQLVQSEFYPRSRFDDCNTRVI